MSFEGFYQNLCVKGHLFHSDPYSTPLCPDCNEPSNWNNLVDDTNCDAYGLIPEEVWGTKFLVSPELVVTCNLGHYHVKAHAVYRQPTEEEKNAERVCLSFGKYVKLTDLKK